jgi:hypothetical protein
MGKRFPLVTLVAACLLSVSAIAQHKTKHFCQQGHKTDELLELHPELKQAIEDKNQELESFTKSFSSKRSSRASTYVIPVVFHIIHLNGNENISDAQVIDAVRIMNEDFNMENDDLDEVVPSFQSIIGDADVEFRLAQLDPNGNPTNGIDRIMSNETNVGDDGSKLNPWPRNMYLNIWVTNQINGAVGAAAYAYLPGTAHFIPNRDGIIANHRYVGSIGTSNQSNKHTLSHEVGHVFNLQHPWGPSNDAGLPSNCSVDDGVNDTPNTIGTIGSCNTSQVSCGSLDNVQNLMDYATCDRMFTQGQVSRMHSTLNSSTAQRNNLWKQANLLATGVGELSTANFNAVDPTICMGESVEFYDISKYNPTELSWTFTGGSIASSTDERPTVTYENHGSFEVSLEAKQNTITKTNAKSAFVMVRPPHGRTATLMEDFESYDNLPNENWYAFQNEYFLDYGWENASTGYQSTKSVKMNNFDAPEQEKFYIETNSYDLSVFTDAKFGYRYAYKSRPGNPGLDRVEFAVSSDCGNTWNTFHTTIGGLLAPSQSQATPYTPQSDSDWGTDSASIPTIFLVDNAVFRISFESRGGNNFYIDNINIAGGFKTQAQLKAPWNTSTDVAIDAPFEWQPMTCDSYELQYDTDANFSNPTSVIQDFVSLNPGSDNTYQTSLNSNQEYFWRVRLINGGTEEDWSETWSFVTGNSVSTNDLDESTTGFSVYPNPANENISIKLNEGTFADEVVIFNAYGQVIFRDLIGVGEVVKTIETSQLTSGLYILQINGSDYSQSKQFVINH